MPTKRVCSTIIPRISPAACYRTSDWRRWLDCRVRESSVRPRSLHYAAAAAAAAVCPPRRRRHLANRRRKTTSERCCPDTARRYSAPWRPGCRGWSYLYICTHKISYTDHLRRIPIRLCKQLDYWRRKNIRTMTFFFIYSFIMRPSSLGGGRILRRTLSVPLSVGPSRYCYWASRRAT